MNTTTLRTVFLLLSGPLVARSQGTLSWHFNATHFTVQPSDQIIVTATVSNLSEVPFTIQGGGGEFAGDLQKTYGFTWVADLFGKTVPGHGTLQFTFGSLTPIGGSVVPGRYYADPAGINFAGIDDLEYLLYSQNTFDITVVPEPSAVSLFGLAGVAGLCVKWLGSRRHPTQKV